MDLIRLLLWLALLGAVFLFAGAIFDQLRRNIANL